MNKKVKPMQAGDNACTYESICIQSASMAQVIKNKTTKSKLKEELTGTFMASIPIIGFAIFGLVPLILALVMAFLNIPGRTLEGATFASLANFSTVLNTKEFWQNIVNTLYMAVSMPISLLLSLIIAYFLSKNLKGSKIFRTLFFIPYTCSVVAITLMWFRILNPTYGIVNEWLGRTGERSIEWLADPKMYIPSTIIIGVWSGTGFGIILFSAAFTNVNPSYIESAKIDGANSFKCFLNIVLPAISPTAFYLFTMGLIGAMQTFALTNILSAAGGVAHKSVGTAVSYIYTRSFLYIGTMGEASAAAWLVSIIIFVIMAANFTIGKRLVSYD